jgi:hypothetical protein
MQLMEFRLGQLSMEETIVPSVASLLVHCGHLKEIERV